MKVIILAVLVGSACTGAALAAQTTGTVASISKKTDTFTLSDGKRFHLPEGIEVESLGVGETVKISYSVGTGRHREVSAVRTVH